jgi:hypothetical protein
MRNAEQIANPCVNHGASQDKRTGCLRSNPNGARCKSPTHIVCIHAR